ncbi:MAG: hypothetical protein GW839_04225 [Flavobacteriales bacterium]|nr:hypothetical protein [Flavobacteriia bacterium]NCP05274.1 hypothetical protein [Flavobacteriales bacterium]PIV95084.1 MAG: hypothetical protein COW44_00920 [Flavobacteriaceae bacterium CG17_big_fil_post_rev_8_21_14_2_50_33_15]PIY09308.1 MAG: hypothetical protein COZ17_13590 [Flavobacteriaceae bacterium CG_4_10_14_3_um_filter_33_47]PJB20282.1 MAG: hypothetical protein CO117_01650 [Flavobacteriaceae bacterium CG_4_9_14_3_um_filter_33_16]
MKLKVILFSLSLFLVSSIGYAQKNKEPKSIISENVSIKKYHAKDELGRMQKGELLGLYIERIETLTKILPYIAFATKPGVTMSTLGIPNDNDNRKALENQFDATKSYIESTVVFQKRILPYSDTTNLIEAILFYEEILKSLHEYSEYH